MRGRVIERTNGSHVNSSIRKVNMLYILKMVIEEDDSRNDSRTLTLVGSNWNELPPPPTL